MFVFVCICMCVRVCSLSSNNYHYHSIDSTHEDGSIGRLMNHSISGNVQPKIVNVDERPVLLLVAKADIPSDAELSYDYGDRRKTILEAHPWLTI